LLIIEAGDTYSYHWAWKGVVPVWRRSADKHDNQVKQYNELRYVRYDVTFMTFQFKITGIRCQNVPTYESGVCV
jgi:hypothetical protein